MNIIDHLSIGVPNIPDAVSFYDPVLAALGLSRLATTDGFAAYGRNTVQFLVMVPEDGQPASAGNGVHICFTALTQTDVDIFHQNALVKGGECAGPPGPRPAYPKPDVYAAFVRDPFGNKLEAIHNGFNA